MARVAVMGAGTWGTTLAVLLARNRHDVCLWARSAECADSIRRERRNLRYLPDTLLSEGISSTDSSPEALAGADVAVFAVPSRAMREVARLAASDIPPGALVITVAKGIEIGTGKRMSEVLQDELADGQTRPLAAVSGPNLSAEVLQGVPTMSVAASADRDAAAAAQALFSQPVFRLYLNEDIAGVELGGALKNIIAIAAGINDGLGFGANSKAALITRGIVEMGRLAGRLGGKVETLAGLAGVGDLIATCHSRHSRNWTVGYRIGRGEQVRDILASLRTVAEGVPTTEAAAELSGRLGVKMPITHELHQVLFEGKAPGVAVKDLMDMELGDELKHLGARDCPPAAGRRRRGSSRP